MNFQVITFQIQQKKPHWYGANIYVVSCISKSSATSGNVEMHTLHILVDVSLLLGTDVSPFPNFNNSVLTTRRNLLLHC